MSREIKFRIWDKKHKRWFHGSTNPKNIALQTDAINLFGEVIVFGEILHDQHEDDVWKNDPNIKSSLDVMGYLEVCQYTGLKDKNGKEIYEGDIVEFGIFGKREAGYVGYADEFASYEVYSKRGFIFGCLFGHAGKVIGNIHENSELLEDKK